MIIKISIIDIYKVNMLYNYKYVDPSIDITVS